MCCEKSTRNLYSSDAPNSNSKSPVTLLMMLTGEFYNNNIKIYNYKMKEDILDASLSDIDACSVGTLLTASAPAFRIGCPLTGNHVNKHTVENLYSLQITPRGRIGKVNMNET